MADEYSPINELSSRLNTNLDDATAEWLKYIQAGAAPRASTPSDVISQAIVSAIPLLGGYLAGGREGLHSGAIGAQTGLETLNQLDAEDQKRQDALNALQANKALQDIQFTRNKLGDIESVQAVEPYRADIQRETYRLNNVEEQKNRLAALAAGHGYEMEEIKARKEGDETFIKSELAKEAINKARAGKLEDVTDDERKALANEGKDAQNLFQRVTEATQVEDRYLDKKEISEMQTKIPGLRVKEGFKPTKEDKRKTQEYISIFQKLDKNLVDLYKSIEKNGQALVGAESAMQIMSISNLARLLRQRSESGASYTQLEEQQDRAQLPKLFADPKTSYLDAVKAMSLGREPKDYISALRKNLRGDLKIDMDLSPFEFKVE